VAQFPALKQEVGARLWLLLDELCELPPDFAFGVDAELSDFDAFLLRIYATLAERKRLDTAEIRFIIRHFREQLRLAYNNQRVPVILAVADGDYVQLMTGDKLSRWLVLRAGHEINGAPLAPIEGISYDLTRFTKDKSNVGTHAQ